MLTILVSPTPVVKVSIVSSDTFANSALVTDTFNSAITNISWTCAITVAGSGSGTSSCANSSGTGNIDRRVSLKPGGIAIFTVTATLDANYSSNTLSNTATVSRSYDAYDSNLSNNTATDTATIIEPRVRLVKRITAVNSTRFTNVINDPNDPNDDLTLRWATNYLQGLIQTDAKPSDIVEYTIYFLSDGINDATNVKICDLIPPNTTFVPQAFNGLTPRDGGLPTDSGIALAIGSATPTNYLTNISDLDRGQFFIAGSTLPTVCTGTNSNGTVLVDLVRSPTLLHKAISAGNPTTSYGFIRFRVRVK